MSTPPELRKLMEEEKQALKSEPPKPYTTPKGFRPPTLGEQYRYAYSRHPYYSWGYGVVLGSGLLAWYWASSSNRGGGKGANDAKQPQTANGNR